MLEKNIVVIRGGGDIASGIACRLFNAGYKVIIVEISEPSVIRRKVAFAQALYEKEVLVEGIAAKVAGNLNEALNLTAQRIVPILIDAELELFKEQKPRILVDAILAKKNLGTNLDLADLVIGVGPGFTAGLDVDAVIETQRGHDLGRVILIGSALPNTGIPSDIGGYSLERVFKSPRDGQLRIMMDIGSMVKCGDILATVDGSEIITDISGVVRGMIQDGYNTVKGMKIADVDPRAAVEHCFSVSDKARAIGGGVLEAILYFTNNLEVRRRAVR